jgi:thiamine-phosphate pyrophosphorylase
MRVARRLNARARAIRPAAVRPAPALPPLFFITDPHRTPDPLRVIELLPKSARGRLGVIYRHFGAENRLETAQKLTKACRKRGLLLLIGADSSLAACVRADGVHLPERMAKRAARLAKRRPNWIITVAAHEIRTLREGQGAHAFLVSPVFETASVGAANRKRLGVRGLVRLTRRAKAPAYALGGVNAQTIQELQNIRGLWGGALATGLLRSGAG